MRGDQKVCPLMLQRFNDIRYRNDFCRFIFSSSDGKFKPWVPRSTPENVRFERYMLF